MKMSPKNSQKLHRESKLFSLLLATVKSMVYKSKNTSKGVQKAKQSYQWEHSIHSYNRLRIKVLSNPNGETKTIVELDEGTIPVQRKERQPSTTSCSLKHDCCSQRCSRTWVANNIGKAAAYLFLNAENAEAWMNSVDAQRDGLIQKGRYRRRIVIELFDLGWTLQLIVGQIAQWFSKFKGS